MNERSKKKINKELVENTILAPIIDALSSVDEEKKEQVIVTNKTPLLDKALNQKLVKIKNVLSSTKINSPDFTEEWLEKARQMIKSGVLPDAIIKPETAIIIMQKGKEMGFPPMASFEHIVVINGKATLDGAALGTVLRRGGVEWEVLQNAESIYDNNKKVVNVTTKIKFYRKSLIFKDKILEHESIFTYKNAEKAGLLGKDTWKKYLKSMLFWRCLALGARQFAPDLTLGMLTPEEIDETGKIMQDENTGKTIQI